MKKYYFSAVILLAALTVLAGCSKRPEGLPKLYPTTITLTTQDGTPIPNVFVAVANPEMPINYTIGGTTNASGEAEMMAQVPNGNFKGAPAGKMKVTLNKSLVIITGDGPDDHTAGQLFPAAYQNINLTPFEMDVADSGTNSAKFECEINEDYADHISE